MASPAKVEHGWLQGGVELGVEGGGGWCGGAREGG